MVSRREVLALGAAAALTACATTPSMQERPPIVFVHGNGDTAALWITTIWRFESNGWPRERLHAIDLPYPLSRDDDAKPQPGRTSTAEHRDFLKAEVEKVLAATGARQVVLVGNSRGGNAIRNYILNAGGDKTVSHAILGGTPNHGIWATPGFREGSEFSGTGPFLRQLNAPKNAAGDEVTGPVKWLTIRSDNNDKYAQPDGLWIGQKGTPTNVTYASPELKGATNIVLPKVDHRETAFAPQAFEAMYRFITGQAPRTTTPVAESRIALSGKIGGLGLASLDPASGSFTNNLPIPGAKLQVFAVDAATGERRGAAAYETKVADDGLWGPFEAQPDTAYEFVVAAPGYATTHIYRSPFPRGSRYLNLRPERIAAADKDAQAIATFTRPRGYFDPARDRMSFDGQNPPPGAVAGAGVASSKLKLPLAPRPVVGEFNGERVVGRLWPAAEGHVTLLELTY